MTVYVEGGSLFSSRQLDDLLRSQKQRSIEAISRIDSEELLNRPLDNLVSQLFDQYHLERTYLCRDKATALPIEETEVDVRNDFSRAVIDQSRPFYVPAVRIRLRIPYTGPNVFYHKASQYFSSYPHGYIDGGSLVVTRLVPSDVLETKREAAIKELHSEIDDIEEALGWIERDLDSWEPEFHKSIETALGRRRSNLLTMRQTELMLGVPIERDNGVAATYIVPALSRRTLSRLEPQKTYQKFAPEPGIKDEDFRDILTDIGRVLAMFERLSITHADANEERLRDQILVTLAGIYGTGSAESFSKRGKTDIYLPWEGNAVFLAECKWWDGPSKFADQALPQLLDRYIVWRDTHTALILFIRNKDVSSVLRQAQQSVRSHPRYVSDSDRTAGFDTFLLHQDGDEDRRLKLALLTAAIIR